MNAFEEKETIVDGFDQPVRMLTCSPLLDAGFFAGFSMRSDALDLSSTGDDLDRIRKNHDAFSSAAGFSPSSLRTLKQIHGDVLTHADGVESNVTEGDALVANDPDLTIGVRTADCVPILIGEPKSRIFAAIHAGWRGTAAAITRKTVMALTRMKSFHVRNAIAAIGPAACGSCYEVGAEVRDGVVGASPKAEACFRRLGNEKFTFDGVQANRLQLLEAGVLAENIYTAGRCTMHEPDAFFSHRRQSKAGERAGRHLAVIYLRT